MDLFLIGSLSSFSCCLLSAVYVLNASVYLAFCDLPDDDLSDHGFDSVPLLDPFLVYLITEGIHHLSQAITLSFRSCSLRFPCPILLADVTFYVLHLLGLLCCELLQVYYPLIQALVERGLLHEFVSQVSKVYQLDLVSVHLI